MRWRAAPFCLLLLTGCDAQPVIQNTLACQQRIVNVRSAELLDPAGAADISGSFRNLGVRYAALDRADCSETQKRRLAQLEQQSIELARLAAEATKAGRSAAARNSRLPGNDANIAFMTALQDFENRQAQLRRDLRAMSAQ